MFLTHGRGGQRFNSVKNPVRDLSNYRAAKQNRDLFRKLYMIYEIPRACADTLQYAQTAVASFICNRQVNMIRGHRVAVLVVKIFLYAKDQAAA